MASFRRAVAAVALLLLALPAAAEVYAIELAVLSCAACREVNGHIASLERAAGEHFRFAPVPTGTNTNAERAWYALRNRPEASAIRGALFDLTQTMQMADPSPVDVIEWLNLYAGVDDLGIRSDDLFSAAVDGALGRAARLAVAAEISRVPAVVFVKNGAVAGVIEKGDLSADVFVRQAVDQYRRLAAGDKP